jgi:hypothetical protein
VPQARLFDWRVYDFRRRCGRRAGIAGACLVAIDEPSFADVIGWPWPRGLHGQLIKLGRPAQKSLRWILCSNRKTCADQLLRGRRMLVASTEPPHDIGDANSKCLPLQMFRHRAAAGNAAVDLDEDAVFRRIPPREGTFADVVLQRAASGCRGRTSYPVVDPSRGGIDTVSIIRRSIPRRTWPGPSDRIASSVPAESLGRDQARGGTDNFEVTRLCSRAIDGGR